MNTKSGDLGDEKGVAKVTCLIWSGVTDVLTVRPKQKVEASARDRARLDNRVNTRVHLVPWGRGA